MTMYRAWVKDKETKQVVRITSEYNSKKELIADLRRNGYTVYPSNVEKVGGK